MLPYTDVQFAPGSKYSYSNPGVIFLGRIIQLLSGDDYEVYVTKNILMPLGMHSTFFDRAPYYLLPHRSHCYFRDEAGLREARFDFDTGITVSNGGLNSPFDDMAQISGFLLGDRCPQGGIRRGAEASVARGDVDAADPRSRGRRRQRGRLDGRAVVLRRAAKARSSWLATAAIRTASSRICICIRRARPPIWCRSTRIRPPRRAQRVPARATSTRLCAS